MVLGEVLHHPQLYLAYPELKNTPVRLIEAALLGDGKLAALRSSGQAQFVEIATGAPEQELRSQLLRAAQLLINRLKDSAMRPM